MLADEGQRLGDFPWLRKAVLHSVEEPVEMGQQFPCLAD